ncbi:MAG TPA: TetR/AcrR family transcriptional regulator [Spirochaetota bacterium]|nr:TetR/AcrR family transcriptional regulator [Spirochaetota bacterium]HPC39400.1 TetR/AcrR family transcriptional regulator [Spirochaetota bacterium]HPL16887.1 TetR/AcrR family transcriptional regulator [Spirochaetota bacterium]HQF06737.1 TetR/AcrR family transcriptional regulator [Spirochaetota bacterium]HQH95644.1 TetR/AcrR family transcriptional regulator [Spirochaetota bacterium]
MTFQEFSKRVMVSVEDLCRDFYRENRATIKVKKEETAVKNLVTIVNTTLKLSYKKGFDAMSLRDLSGESGLSMGALYSYFGSKEDLLSMIQYHGQLAVERILRDHIDRGSGPREKLRNAIRIHLYLSELMKSWFYFFFMETKNLNKKYRKISVESELMTERVITDILEEGVKGNIFTVENIPLTGSVIKAMMQDWYLKQWKYTQRKISVEEYAEYVISMVESHIMKKAQ